MSNYIQDLGSLVSTAAAKTATHNKTKTSPDLDMTDFLQLMVVQLQSQTIDNTADTSDMLNQMVQMQMVTALTNMTEASLMSYAGSLVGKEVTIGDYSSGQLVERVVTITGTGVSGGEQVLFAGDETFELSDVMAVGKLPAKKEENSDGKDDAGGDPSAGKVENGGSTASPVPSSPGGDQVENSGSNTANNGSQTGQAGGVESGAGGDTSAVENSGAVENNASKQPEDTSGGDTESNGDAVEPVRSVG